MGERSVERTRQYEDVCLPQMRTEKSGDLLARPCHHQEDHMAPAHPPMVCAADERKEKVEIA